MSGADEDTETIGRKGNVEWEDMGRMRNCKTCIYLALWGTVVTMSLVSVKAQVLDVLEAFHDTDVDLMLKSCTDLPSSLREQPILNQRPEMSADGSTYTPQTSFGVGIPRLGPSSSQTRGEEINGSTGLFSFDSTMWYIGPRSAGVGWVVATWELYSRTYNPELPADPTFGGLGDEQVTGRRGRPIFHVNAVGLLWRSPRRKDTNQYYNLCMLGYDYKLEDNGATLGDLHGAGPDGETFVDLPDISPSRPRRPALSCNLRIDLQYTAPQRSVRYVDRRHAPEHFQWEGEMTVIDQAKSRSPQLPPLRIRGNPNVYIDAYEYIFQDEAEAKSNCPGSTTRKTGWLSRLLGWRYPSLSMMYGERPLLQIDSPVKPGAEYMLEGDLARPVIAMSPICYDPKYGTPFDPHPPGGLAGGLLEVVELPSNSSKALCFSQDYWIVNQFFNGLNVSFEAPQGKEEEEEHRVKAPRVLDPARVAMETSIGLPDPGGKGLTWKVILEGTYSGESGQLCLRGCRTREETGDEAEEVQWTAGLPTLQMGPEGLTRAGAERPVEQDCMVQAVLQFPRYFPWPLILWREPLKAVIRSLRSPEDVLYFAEIRASCRDCMTEREAHEAFKRTEATVAGGLLLASLVVVCLAAQIRYLKTRPEELPHFSILTPTSFAIGLALVIWSSVFQDSFLFGDAPFWAQFSRSGSEPAPVLAAWAAACLLSAYLVHQIVTERRRRRRPWTRMEGPLAQRAHGPEMEIPLLEKDEETEFPEAPRPGLGVAPAALSAGRRSQKFWSPQRSSVLCIPVYVLASLYPLWTLQEWSPEPYGDEIDPTRSSRQDAHNVIVVLGAFGSLLQDLFLLPQLVYLATLEKAAMPVHPLFAYGLTLARLGAHCIEPFATPAGGFIVVFVAAYYLLLSDLPAWKASRMSSGTVTAVDSLEEGDSV